MSDASTCPFCARTDADCFHVAPLVRAFWDGFPVSPGHALVVPRRHVAGWWDATEAERGAMLAATDAARAQIARTHRPPPDGWNLGVNVGAAGGQTVPHLHLHVIPRWTGDVPDPRGGVRHVIPEKGNYLAVPARGSAATDDAPHAGSLVRGAGRIAGVPDDPLLPHLHAHLARAHEVDVAVAFAMTSGVALVEEHLRDVLGRGGRVRVLTGDYLGVTDPDALLRLLDLDAADGRFALRVFESGATSFHPKGYLCVDAAGEGTAFVGSSNLSRAALRDGVEWNWRVLTSRDGPGFADVRRAFEALWRDPRARPADAGWIAGYRARRSMRIAARDAGGAAEGAAEESPLPVPRPHAVQEEALRALADTRARGLDAGLVVLATGLGKTWLAAFDSERAGARRVLFVAHREEILDQALRTFRTIRPRAALGRYTGAERVADAAVVLASVQTLGRRRHLERFTPDAFDYVVVDEFHHAAAPTYRRLLDHFTPRFLLGLTATPERTDGADLLALCGEHLAYRCDLAEGIGRGLLAPFDYYGVPDEVDYRNIPWRSGRFDETALTNQLAIASRADNALDQLRRRGGRRAVGFCSSQRHADFMRAHFTARGLRAAAVHAGATSDPRARSLERLQGGELDVVFAVDMFNEGVDLPDLDTVLMLRPTESPVLWLQQLGRGLRWREGKRLKVIDYIGNHRAFLLKPRTLFQLDAASEVELSAALRLADDEMAHRFLPAGCSVTYELEAREILRALVERTTGTGALARLEEYYRDFRDRTGVRPTASEALHDGFDPGSARPGHGSWPRFVRQLGDLGPAHDAAELALREFLQALETTPMTRSYKMLVLLAMLAEGAFPGCVPVARLAARVRTIARRTALLRTELGDALDDDARLVALLERNPIAAWVGGEGTGGARHFAYADGVFATTFDVAPALREAAADLARELADWRLAVYLRRAVPSGASRIVARVSHAGERPILFLPPRERLPGIPEGWVEVSAGGVSYQANFAKVAVNVAHRQGHEDNALPELLRGWFGPQAGLPGTTNQVVFERTHEGYTLAPLGDEATRGPRPYAPYTRAAAAQALGLTLKGFEAQSGVVDRQGLLILFVTLDKTGKPEAHQYEDGFLAPDTLRWQSQNRTRQDGRVGRMIAQQGEPASVVHLFVRAAAKVGGRTEPFTYCGTLRFERWEGERPITVWWRLDDPVPIELRARLRVPDVPPDR